MASSPKSSPKAHRSPTELSWCNSRKADRSWRNLEHFQQKCETVLRAEMRQKQRDRVVPTIPFKQEPQSSAWSSRRALREEPARSRPWTYSRIVRRAPVPPDPNLLWPRCSATCGLRPDPFHNRVPVHTSCPAEKALRHLRHCACFHCRFRGYEKVPFFQSLSLPESRPPFCCGGAAFMGREWTGSLKSALNAVINRGQTK